MFYFVVLLCVCVATADIGSNDPTPTDCHHHSARSSLPVVPCTDDSDCETFGAKVKCVDTGTIDGNICLYCRCNQSSQCLVVGKGNGVYKVVGCDCGTDNYGDYCMCPVCNCKHKQHTGCDEGWKHHDGMCYRLFGNDETWNNVDMGICNLATIDNEELNHFFIDMYREVSGNFWIGARKIGGEWRWSNSVATYLNFEDGEDAYDCAYMRLNQGELDNGKWFSAPCTDKNNYICESPVFVEESNFFIAK